MIRTFFLRPISICLVVAFLSACGASSGAQDRAAAGGVLPASKSFTQSASATLVETLMPSTATTGRWRPGWDVFTEPLNYSTSSVKWTANPTTRELTILYTLEGARPNKLYQVGVHIFCTTHGPTFGEFPIHSDLGFDLCAPNTRQGVTKPIVNVELGVVTTDIRGNGTFIVSVVPIVAGTYHLEFTVRNGAGCEVLGATGSCSVDFQSPGPYGTTTTITI